jgi:hypothetical protein
LAGLSDIDDGMGIKGITFIAIGTAHQKIKISDGNFFEEHVKILLNGTFNGTYYSD